MSPLLPPPSKSHPVHGAPEAAEQPGQLPGVGALMVVAGGVPSGSDPHPTRRTDPQPATDWEDAA
ncbi:hypothetical protein ACFQ71_31435 [Streptomyces sp. NPDC056534]|uniref:hypothetical protein n=1 Tax=Streptomyces sp. NPDC056534 TaxID=3345857 RepID=UPI0036C18656